MVAHGIKTIEIRRWVTNYRGILLIHAARIDDERNLKEERYLAENLSSSQLRGGIIGAVEITDCKRYSSQANFDADRYRHWNHPDWFQEKLQGFVFTRSLLLPFFTAKGNVRLFTATPTNEALKLMQEHFGKEACSSNQRSKLDG